MKILNSIAELQAVLKTVDSKSLGFVPTLGGLHKGHMALVEKSLSENNKTIVSLFLNPTQFNKKEDLETYPADLKEDLNLLEECKIDFVFCPNKTELYPQGYKYTIIENEFSKKLCGKFRPGHFEGVLTVVMKLLNLIKPEKAYFGEKDYQQLTLIKAMAKDFFIQTEICGVPTVREESGLAFSSRNRKLTKSGLVIANKMAHIFHSQQSLEDRRARLLELDYEPEYLEQYDSREYIAGYIEGVRMIDNKEAYNG